MLVSTRVPGLVCQRDLAEITRRPLMGRMSVAKSMDIKVTLKDKEEVRKTVRISNIILRA